MNRYDLKRPIGWVMIILSVVVVLGTTLRGRYGGDPLLHQLVPYFGIPFVVMFLAAQAWLCFWFRTKIGLAWITGAFVIGLIGGSIRESVWGSQTISPPNPVVERVLNDRGFPTSNYDWTRHKLITGVCLSGAALGFGFVREKL